jgi:hypothetical protein
MEPGIYALAGAIIGGLFTYLSSQRSGYVAGLERELRRIKKAHITACQQIKGYYHLEARYMVEMGKLTNQAERTVQINYRDVVEIAGHPRPNWTAKDADYAIAELDG